ncbi:helix-turn-helix domain-containing protein [Patescibacteria group bacterium]|nr:helix-turn-helix domain-containing protein [Patescibacteria group bacterium]
MLTVGEILQKQRLNKGLTLQDIEKKIKVREKYLHAVEENNWEFFSSKIYITGIIKNYSRLVGLDEKKILAFFRRDYEKKEEVRFKKKVSENYLAPETKKILRLGFVILILFFLSYFGYQLLLYFSPPNLTIISPKTTSFVHEDRITVIGQTDKDATVMISGQRIYQNKDGVFSYDFPLHDGSNTLSIELTGANGKKSVIKKVFTNKASF